jgi:2,4-dienoyl-CoA reductase (NADPH2)
LKSFLKYFSPQTLAALTRIWLPVGKRVIVIGGRIHGCETAEFLIKRGRQVTILDEADALGEGMTGDDKYLLFPWFDRKGVKRYTGIKYRNIEKGKIAVRTKDGQELTLEADTILTALPLSPNNEIMGNLKGRAHEVYFIGDCNDPKLIAEATASGATTASKI